MSKTLFASLSVCFVLFAASPAVAIQEVIINYRLSHDITAFWDFNGANAFADKTGNGNTLTPQGGGPTFSAAAASGNGWSPVELTAATVNGETARVGNFNGGVGLDMPAGIYTGGDFTFFLAQRQPASPAFRTLLGTNRFRYQNVFNTVQGAINAPGGSFGGSSPLSAPDWHWIALTYDNTSKQLLTYTLTNSGTLGGPVLTGSASGVVGLSNITALRIGNDGLSLIGGPDGFFGQIDAAGFHNGLLSLSELQLLVDDFVLGPEVTAVPEPSTCVLLGLGVAGLVLNRRRRHAGEMARG